LTSPEQIDGIIENLGYEVIHTTAPAAGHIDLKITGMTCAACSARIEKKLNALPGISQAVVNLASEKASVDYDPKLIKTGDMIKSIEQLGYSAERLEELSREL